SGVADQNDGILKEVRVGLVVDCGSTEGKILETSFSLALSDFYGINNEYGTITIVSVLARDPLLVFAARDYKPSQECKSRSYCWCTIITKMQQLEPV
ncbi:unnamed protein product, partial [Brassica rapa subsp. narinosa]